jgi:hypothetical protein
MNTNQFGFVSQVGSIDAINQLYNKLQELKSTKQSKY